MNSREFRKHVRCHSKFRSTAELFTAILMIVGKQKKQDEHGRWESDWDYHFRVEKAAKAIAPRLASTGTCQRFIAWQRRNHAD